MLNPNELLYREKEYGHGRKPKQRSNDDLFLKANFFLVFSILFCKILKSPVLLIWLLCSILAMCLDLSFSDRRMPIVWVDALAILLVFLVTFIISALNDYQTEKKLEQLRLAQMEQVFIYFIFL